MNLRQLAERLQRGDSIAEAELYERYAARLIRLAHTRLHRIFHSKVGPDDVVQSAFRSFFMRCAAGQYEIDSWESLWSLLAMITVRKCRAKAIMLQAAKRDVRREESPDATDNLEQLRALSSREPSAEEAAILQETIEALTSNMTDEQREVVLLKLQQHNNREIATKIGRTERTVYRILVHARQKLEAQLAVDEKTNEDKA